MSEDLTRKFVEFKTKEMTRAVASKTGVAEADVAKVLDHLGLSSALANRLNVTSLRAAASGAYI